MQGSAFSSNSLTHPTTAVNFPKTLSFKAFFVREIPLDPFGLLRINPLVKTRGLTRREKWVTMDIDGKKW